MVFEEFELLEIAKSSHFPAQNLTSYVCLVSLIFGQVYSRLEKIKYILYIISQQAVMSNAGFTFGYFNYVFHTPFLYLSMPLGKGVFSPCAFARFRED